MRRGFGGGGGSMARCCGSGQYREAGEKAFRQGRFKDAVKNFNWELNTNPNDTRCLLGVANSYIALREYKNALLPLSQLRNECHRHRCDAETEESEENGFQVTPMRSSGSNSDLDSLPKQAREALDCEARQSLETTVLALTKHRKLPRGSASDDYKNEHHYLVLRSCLALAKDCHAQSKPEELQALFILAKENTRNVPSSLICELTANGTPDQQWSKLARLVLNATVPEEKEFYLDELMFASRNLPQWDIRTAASNHYFGLNGSKEGCYFELSEAQEIVQGLDVPYDQYLANCAYDKGVVDYKTNNSKGARENLQKALGLYQRLNRKIDIADTEYNLGCLEYRDGHDVLAKTYFKSAATNYRLDKTYREDERLASYNAGALAIDGKANPIDDRFLSEFNNRFSSVESATLLGLHRFKRGLIEEALEPLKFGAEESLSFSASCWPMDSTITNDGAYSDDDKSYSDQEVLREMFSKSSRIDQCVNSRFQPATVIIGAQSTSDNQMSSARTSYFKPLAIALYQQALIRRNYSAELSRFREQLRAFKYIGPELVSSRAPTEAAYLTLLKNTIGTNWYAPLTSISNHTIVRLRIDKAGQLIVTSLSNEYPAVNARDRQILNQQTITIKDEALKWASPMPPPPVTLVDKEIVVLFDGHAPSEVDMLPYAMPIPGRRAGGYDW
jgi:tetratricopeptide (TPR) repeat protein